jgi:hypothetical protein
LNLSQNFCAFGFPDVALRRVIALTEVVENSPFKFRHTTKASRRNYILTEVSEKSFYSATPPCFPPTRCHESESGDAEFWRNVSFLPRSPPSRATKLLAQFDGQLEEYCGLDTEGMWQIISALRNLV